MSRATAINTKENNEYHKKTTKLTAIQTLKIRQNHLDKIIS